MQLCIPRIDTYYTLYNISAIMYKLKWGKIIKITESRPKNNTEHRCVMINIEWNDENENGDLKTRLLDGDYINVVHDPLSPQFWRIMESNRRTPYK
jgi:hypothetical protein